MDTSSSPQIHQDGPAGLDRWSDGELLAAYARSRSGDAFAEILRRHAPWVLGVCRRLLEDPHDAEDAAQAAFVVLLKKARQLPPRIILPAWLHGVARLTALKMRRDREHQTQHEREAAMNLSTDSIAPAAQIMSSAAPFLDDALAALSPKLRDAVLLRHVSGLSQEATASRLGCSVSAASVRIARGLEKLRKIMGRHGLAAPGAALTALLNQAQAAEVPARFIQDTLRVCAGEAAAAPSVVALASGAESMLFWMKAKTAAMWSLAIAWLAIGIGWMTRLPAEPADATAGLAAAAATGGTDAPADEFAAFWLTCERPADKGGPYQLVVACRAGKPVAVHAATSDRVFPFEKFDLKLEGGALSGTLESVTINKKEPPPPFSVRLQGSLDQNAIAGEHATKAGNEETKGKLTGRRREETDLRRENAVPAGKSWPAWNGHGDFRAPDSDRPLVESLAQARFLWYSEAKIHHGRDAQGARNSDPNDPRIIGGYTSPIVADGRVYFSQWNPSGSVFAAAKGRGDAFPRQPKWLIDADDEVFCFDAATGQLLWKTIFQGKGLNHQGDNKHGYQNNTPCWAYGKVYAIGSTGRLYALDGRTGKPAWESHLGAFHETLEKMKRQRLAEKSLGEDDTSRKFMSWAGGTVFCQGTTGVTAFDPETGKTLWTSGGSSAARWSHQGKEWVLVFARGELQCLDPKTGQSAWKAKVDGEPLDCYLSVGGDTLVLCQGATRAQAGDAAGYRLSDKGAEKLWTLPGALKASDRINNPAFDGGKVYLRSARRTKEDAGVKAVDLATGKVVAENPTWPCAMCAFCVVAGGRYLTEADATHAHTLFEYLDAATLKVLTERWYPQPGTSAYDMAACFPVVDGRLFVRGSNRIYCFDLRKPAGP